MNTRPAPNTGELASGSYAPSVNKMTGGLASRTLIELGGDWARAADKKTIAEAKVSGSLQGLFDHSLKKAMAGFKMHPNNCLCA